MCRVGWGKSPTVSILSCSYILPTSRKTCSLQTLDITWHFTLPLCYTPHLFIFVVEMQKYKKSRGVLAHTMEQNAFWQGQNAHSGHFTHPPPNTIIHCPWPNKLTILIFSVKVWRVRWACSSLSVRQASSLSVRQTSSLSVRWARSLRVRWTSSLSMRWASSLSVRWASGSLSVRWASGPSVGWAIGLSGWASILSVNWASGLGVS